MYKPCIFSVRKLWIACFLSSSDSFLVITKEKLLLIFSFLDALIARGKNSSGGILKYSGEDKKVEISSWTCSIFSLPLFFPFGFLSNTSNIKFGISNRIVFIYYLIYLKFRPCIASFWSLNYFNVFFLASKYFCFLF